MKEKVESVLVKPDEDLSDVHIRQSQKFDLQKDFDFHIENIKDIMITYTAVDGNFLLPPKKILMLLGYNENDFPKNIWDITDEDDIEKEKALLQELVSGSKDSYSIIKRVFRKDGEISWFLKYSFLVKKDDESIKYVFNYLIDITETKKYEEELQLINYKYKKLLDIMPDIVTILDDGLITFINDAGARTLGFREPNDLIGKEVRNFIADGEEECAKKVAKCIQNVDVVSEPAELKIRKNDDQILHMESINVGFMDGEKMSMLSVLRDITEKKKNEALKEEAMKNAMLLEQAKEADKVKNEFLANISHELRTPLNVIMGVLQLLTLLESQESLNYSSFEKYIKLMRQNCYRLLRLINNLIDISKIDAGFFKIRLKKCDIIKTVEDITLSVAEYAKSKGISLIFDTDEEEKTVYCDQDQIERIILNLLGNAIKFTHSGGNIDVNMESTEDYVRIKIKDNGIGIPEDQIGIIFERFKQVGNGYGGSGIGLSLVKSLVELHGGNIIVNSKVDHGSEFIVTLYVGKKAHIIKDEEKEDVEEKQNNYDNIKIEFSDIYSD